ncbi:MAG: hypothetical protein QOJ70_3654 [Acidobacteriota bacterium]|nr:hypothetical protein [Acidobacteriota bacterium]
MNPQPSATSDATKSKAHDELPDGGNFRKHVLPDGLRLNGPSFRLTLKRVHARVQIAKACVYGIEACEDPLLEEATVRQVMRCFFAHGR